MNKKATFLCICAMIGIVTYSQKADPLKLYLTEFQKLIYVTSDSVYKFTKFIEENGNFYFAEEFMDSTYSDAGTIMQFDKNEITGRNKLKFKYIPGIDTVNSCYPIRNIEYDSNSIINIIDEVRYSYILKQFGESMIIASDQNIIRVLYPYEDLNYCKSYFLFTIRFFADSVKLYRIMGRSTDYKGIKMICNDSSILKKNDIERIKKQLSNVTVISDATCRKPGNPWILEYKNNNEYKHFVISNYCVRGERELVPVIRLCFLIMEISKKYFNIDCSVNK